MVTGGSSSGFALSEVLVSCNEEYFKVWPGLIYFRFLVPKFTVVGIYVCLKYEFVSDTNHLFRCVFIFGTNTKGYSAIDLLIKRFDRLVWIENRLQLCIVSSQLISCDVVITGIHVFNKSHGGDVRVTN